MYELKQSTAITIPFFAFDSNGDGVTGKVDGDWTKRISKGGGAFAAMTVTITEMENGWYSLPIGAGHVDTLGVLSMSFSATGVKRVNLQWRVEARIIDDLATSAALATVQADTDNIQTRLPAALISGRMDSNTQAMATNVITSTIIDATAITEIVTAIWDEDATGHQTLGTFGKAIGDPGADTDTIWALVNANLDAAISAVLARLPTTLVGGRIDASVGAMAADVVTAAAIANGAIDAATFAAGAIDATAIAANAIGASELAADAAQEIADEFLNRDLAGGASGGSRGVRNALRALRNRRAIAAGTLTVYQENDSTSAWTAAVTTTAGNPVSEVDPA